MTANDPRASSRRVVIIGAHLGSGPSMLRYTGELERAYSTLGHEVSVLRPTDALSRHAPGPIAKWLRYVEKLVLFPVAIWTRTRRADLVHIADHSDAPYVGWVHAGRPRLITCHDLFAVNAARNMYPGVRTRWTGRVYQAYIARSLRRADAVIAVSEQTAEDVRRLLGQRMPIYVVPNPLSESMLSVGPAAEERTEHVLIVSGVSWRKRRELAIRVWCQLRREAEIPPLVVVGPPFTTLELDVLAEFGVSKAEVSQRAAVPDEELVRLYRESAFLIQFSQYEGYCWPILEANSQATLALCADEPQLRAVGPDNVFVEAATMKGMDAGVILQQLAEPAARKRAAAHARAFTPRRFAESLGAVVSDVGLGDSRMGS